MSDRAKLLLVLASLAAAPCASAQSQLPRTAHHYTVLELFTSQGCSSCPPADVLLKAYSNRPGIMALSLSVDYWDHLGWKDTLATPKNTLRQKAYVKALGTGNVYTPQLVAGGAFQTVGSNKAEIEKVIALAGKDVAKSPVALSAVSDSKRLTIEIGAEKQVGPATVWLAIVSPVVDVEIKRGENRGRTIAYHNVVRDISPVGMWSGGPMKVELPASALMRPGDRCAVIVQGDDGGRILAATWLTVQP